MTLAADDQRSLDNPPPARLGVRANLPQFAVQTALVFLVGLTVGSTRTALPALAEREFGLPPQAPVLLATIVLAFGVVKASMNFAAGAMSERLGRKWALALGWLAALPIPFLLRWAPNWNWVIAAAALLGVNQGLAWTMTLTSQLDLARHDERGLTNGVNEFAGYAGVALAGLATARLADALGARTALFWFTLVVIGLGLAITLLAARETHPPRPARSTPDDSPVRFNFADRRMVALCQAGLVEKFVDALVWLAVPAWLHARGMGVGRIGVVAGCYGVAWGGAQLITGPLSDRVGRKPVISLGMLVCGGGIALMLARSGVGWWCACAALSGLGMSALYPTLGASVSDLAPDNSRGVALGVYRFWRDLGYAAGALAIGAVARVTGAWESAFWLVASAMAFSTLVYLAMGEETRPASRPRDSAR